MDKQLKILIGAYACHPQRGSEEGVGWGWVNAIASKHKLWVIVEASQKAAIENAVRQACAHDNIHFYYVPRIHQPILEYIWPPSRFWTYRLWQRQAFQLATRLQHEVQFDIAHQLTYVGFRAPGYFWQLNIPFVWGPIGGLENTRWRLLPLLGLKGVMYYAARNIINTLHKRWLRAPKLAFAKAHQGIIAATTSIRQQIFLYYGQTARVICEIGPPATIAKDYSKRQPAQPLKLCWSGQHHSAKGLPILLRALATLPADIHWQLDILGDGECTPKWRRIAAKLNIDSNCQWHGWVTRDRALTILHAAHLFIITSIKDLTSTVLLEALSQGVPVICPDLCGFADVVTEDCGLKVPVESPRQLIIAFNAAIRYLAANENQRRLLAYGALHRIADFSWEKKLQALESVYERVMV